MFKKGKAGSGFKAGAVNATDTERRELLSQLGYQFDSVTKKSGWFWTSPVGQCERNQSTEADVIADAWRDAGDRTCETMKIPSETWDRMGIKEQGELIEEALSGQ